MIYLCGKNTFSKGRTQMYIKTTKTERLLPTIAVMLVLAFTLSFAGCSKKDEKSEGGRVLAYENIDISSFVKLGQYTGLNVTLLDGETEAQAVWRVIEDSSEILGYPEEQVQYYLSQSRTRCDYYASIHNVSYEEALKALGYSEEAMLEEARSLVASDLLAIAVRKSAGVALTDEEKDRLFDKYAEKYAYDWGYNLSYVKDSLAEEIFDLMLYDKTSEYLIKNNTFVKSE